MSDPTPVDDRLRADLVAFLDGELDGEASRTLERRLSLDPAVRAEAEALKQAWDLLDHLPRAEASPTFTSRTLERLAPLRTTGGHPGRAPAANPAIPVVLAPSRRGRALLWKAVAWAAAVLLALGGGYAAGCSLFTWEAGERELVHELRVIDNLRLYRHAEDLETLKELDRPELFGEDAAAGL